MAVSGGEVFIDLLESHGIEYIFCSPGSDSSPGSPVNGDIISLKVCGSPGDG